MLESKQILNSYNFARNSDIVFSEILTHDQFNKLNIEDYTIVNKNSRFVFYKLNKFHLKENDVIFCNTDMVKSLFYLLKGVKNLKNIKLITNQTDTLIDKSLFNLKPNCIKDWYSVNVGFKSENLIPIPLGLSNNYSPKNIFVEDIEFSGMRKDTKNLLYLNFVANTNSKERAEIYNTFKETEWAYADSPKLNLDKYQKSLEQYRFVLSPHGNGIDTHRVWETLYSGNIPVTKSHHTFDNVTDLPILFVEEYEHITHEMLINYYESLEIENIDYEKLNIDFWIKKIKNTKILSKESQEIKAKKLATELFIFNYKFKSKAQSKKKKLLYYLKKIHKIKKLFKK